MCFQSFKETVFKQLFFGGGLSLIQFSHQPVLYIMCTVTPTIVLSGYLSFRARVSLSVLPPPCYPTLWAKTPATLIPWLETPPQEHSLRRKRQRGQNNCRKTKTAPHKFSTIVLTKNDVRRQRPEKKKKTNGCTERLRIKMKLQEPTKNQATETNHWMHENKWNINSQGALSELPTNRAIQETS